MTTTPTPAEALSVAIRALEAYGAIVNGDNAYKAEIVVLKTLRLLARTYHHADDHNEIVCTVPDCVGCDTYTGNLA